MNLKIMLPDEILIDRSVIKITAEGENGNFCLLPRHIDFVSSLVPGILTFLTEENEEGIVALNEGVLVKQGNNIMVSVTNAVQGNSLDRLNEVVREEYKQLNEREKLTRSVLAKLEVDTLRHFARLGDG